MGTSLIPGMSDAQWDILMGAAQSSRNDIATKGSIQPATPIPTPQAGSTTKTPTQYVPYISANKDPNGGNTTEYRAPRAGDTGIGVTVPTPTPTPTPTVNTPQPTVPTGLYQDPYARTPEQIAALAKQRIDAILQAGKTSAQGALTGAKNAYDYTNQIEGDTRTLRNASLKESANPFGGNFGYLASTNTRNDSIQDTAQDKDYNAAVGQINQKLADLQAAAPGQEQQIIDDLQQIERQTGISVAQLQLQQQGQQAQYTGQYLNPQTGQYQNTIQKDAQDLQNVGQAQQNLLNQYKIDSYPAEQQANATKIQQELATGKMNLETAKYNFEQLKDPNSPKNQADKIDLQLKQLDLSTYSQTKKLELQKLQKEIAQIGVVHYKPQTSTEIEMDKVNLATAKAKLAELQNPAAIEVDSKDSTDHLSFFQGQIDSRTNLTKDQQLGYAQSQKPLLSDSDYNKLVAYINKIHEND